MNVSYNALTCLQIKPQTLQRPSLAFPLKWNAWTMALFMLFCVFLGRITLGIALGGTVETSMPPLVADHFVVSQTSRRRKPRRTGELSIDSSIQAASYSRYSSDHQSEKSIVDQQRECRDCAERQGHAISAELEFVDEAISGTKRDRFGLNSLIAAAKAGQIHVLYFHSLSRLSRESVITLPLLKELVYKYDVRIISVSEGIDSNETSWELIAHIMSIVHEQYLRDLAANVLRGLEGRVLDGKSAGDFCFGYGSEPVPGSSGVRRGRNDRPPKIYTIDPEKIAWVERIFHWFVRERRSQRWIVRELNRLGAPKDHRATTKGWRHQYLPGLLRNRKYIGRWPWGEKKNVRDPLTGRIKQVERDPEECEKWLRHFPHLQVIDDETFAEADRLLTENAETYAANRKKNGELGGSSPGASQQQPRHLLSGLVQCGECGSTFHVGGSSGKYLFCSKYAQGACSCQTQLRRDRAERMILSEIGKRILTSPAWHKAVFDAALKHWHAQEAHLPKERAAAEKALADVERRISNLLDRVENGDETPELASRLAKRRKERQDLSRRAERLRQADESRRPEPTEAWVAEQLDHLGEVLTETNPAAAHALRDLVGGQIVVSEIRRPGSKRHYLQGRLTIASTTIVEQTRGTDEEGPEKAGAESEALTEEIVIDFREPLEIEALAERAKELYDQGMMNALIAKQLGCSRKRVTEVLKYWFESRGLKMPDGRSRRSSLKKKHVEPPLYQTIADEVVQLYQKGELLQCIAEQMSLDPHTVVAAIKWWHEERGLLVPDGRTRRKSLDRKTSS